mmetsp:Transcript_704/g.1749  ORF Transcript_704/g.1749 Transcript_704/m.1749 type:complete len:224 (+) Transcript_704:606-1277(+)
MRHDSTTTEQVLEVSENDVAFEESVAIRVNQSWHLLEWIDLRVILALQIIVFDHDAIHLGVGETLLLQPQTNACGVVAVLHVVKHRRLRLWQHRDGADFDGSARVWRYRCAWIIKCCVKYESRNVLAAVECFEEQALILVHPWVVEPQVLSRVAKCVVSTHTIVVHHAIGYKVVVIDAGRVAEGERTLLDFVLVVDTSPHVHKGVPTFFDCLQFVFVESCPCI